MQLHTCKCTCFIQASLTLVKINEIPCRGSQTNSSARLTLILPVLAFNFRRCEAVKIFVDLAFNTVSALQQGPRHNAWKQRKRIKDILTYRTLTDDGLWDQTNVKETVRSTRIRALAKRAP